MVISYRKYFHSESHFIWSWYISHRRVLVRGAGSALGSSLPLSSVASASSSSSPSVRIDIVPNSASGGGRMLGGSLVDGSGGHAFSGSGHAGTSASRIAAASTATASAAGSAKSEAEDPAFPQAQDEGDGVGYTYR